MTDGIVGKVTWDGFPEPEKPDAHEPLAAPKLTQPSGPQRGNGIVGKVTWGAFPEPATPTPVSEPDDDDGGRNFGEVAGDLATGLAQGAESAGLAIPQLVNTLTGGAVDRYVIKPVTGALDKALGGPGEGWTLAEGAQRTRDALDTFKSDELLEHEKALAETKGFVPSFKRIITDPVLLSQQLMEQLPQFIAPAGAARKAGAVALERVGSRVFDDVLKSQVAKGFTRESAERIAAKAAERVGQKAARKAGARAVQMTGGAIGAAQASGEAQQDVLGMDAKTLEASRAYQQLMARPGMTDKRARETLAQIAGLKAAAIAGPLDYLVGGLTSKLESGIFRGDTGLEGLGQLLTRRGLAQTGKAAGKEFVEEALQEGPSEQFAQNVGVRTADPTRSLGHQVPEQAALGGALGTLFGAGGTAISSSLTRPKGPIERAADEAPKPDAARATTPTDQADPSEELAPVPPAPWMQDGAQTRTPSIADIRLALHQLADQRDELGLVPSASAVTKAWGIPRKVLIEQANAVGAARKAGMTTADAAQHVGAATTATESQPSAQAAPESPPQETMFRVEPLGDKGILVHGDPETLRARLAEAGFRRKGRLAKGGGLRFDAKDRGVIETALGLGGEQAVDAATNAPETLSGTETAPAGQPGVETSVQSTLSVPSNEVMGEAENTPNAAEMQQKSANVDENELPEGWTELAPGRMVTNRDRATGGIVDRHMGVTGKPGKWFAMPHTGKPTGKTFDTRAEA
ncbi:MAG: hypothetical protein L0H83_01365, partial [Salinisphaera sp.]|nr:hypothetical protein [Salinisphaera sp.]